MRQSNDTKKPGGSALNINDFIQNPAVLGCVSELKAKFSNDKSIHSF